MPQKFQKSLSILVRHSAAQYFIDLAVYPEIKSVLFLVPRAGLDYTIFPSAHFRASAVRLQFSFLPAGRRFLKGANPP
jgi:hypothetical protein